MFDKLKGLISCSLSKRLIGRSCEQRGEHGWIRQELAGCDRFSFYNLHFTRFSTTERLEW